MNFDVFALYVYIHTHTHTDTHTCIQHQQTLYTHTHTPHTDEWLVAAKQFPRRSERDDVVFILILNEINFFGEEKKK